MFSPTATRYKRHLYPVMFSMRTMQPSWRGVTYCQTEFLRSIPSTWSMDVLGQLWVIQNLFLAELGQWIQILCWYTLCTMPEKLTNTQWKEQIHDLVQECEDLVAELPLDVTDCFMDVVSRMKTRGIQLTPEQFNEYSKLFNYLLSRLHKRSVDGEPMVNPGLGFSKARAWRYSCARSRQHGREATPVYGGPQPHPSIPKHP